MKRLLTVAAAVSAFALGLMVGKGCSSSRQVPPVCDTTVVERRVALPVVRASSPDSSAVARQMSARLPVAAREPHITAKVSPPHMSDTTAIQYVREEVTEEVSRTREDPDSVDVEIPISMHRYSGDNYEAWVSGYAASLDSIRVYAPVREVTITERAAPKRWHIGITAGVAMTPRGFQPYIGGGITYSFISF